MIDVHCHINFHKFETDYDEVINRALARGVTRIINTGTKIDSSLQAIKLAEQYEELYAIVGVHPHHADKVSETYPEDGERELPDNWIEQLEEMTKHPKVVGIGECGMDFYSYASNGIWERR